VVDSSVTIDPARQRRTRVWFALTVILILAVVVLLPRALISMLDQLRDEASSEVFDVFSGTTVDFSAAVPSDASFVNIAITDIDEIKRTASLTISGNRTCSSRCLPVTATLFSIGQEASRRLGLPPSGTFALPTDSGPYTEHVELPIQGWPQRYPFDTYTLTLGFAAEVTPPSGRPTAIDAQMAQAQHLIITIEDGVSRLLMNSPLLLDPTSVRSPGSSLPYFSVARLRFERPPYLRILAILLVLLMASSAVFALSLRDLEDLLLGIGGIILGIWGVRSVVVQTALPDLTWVDMALAMIILLLLLGLAIRAARHFYQLCGFRGA
jgi:hypothetical protein